MEEQTTEVGIYDSSKIATVVAANEILNQELVAERFIVNFLNTEIVHLRRHVRALESQADRLLHLVSELELELAAYRPGVLGTSAQTTQNADMKQLEGVALWFALEAEAAKAASKATWRA